MREPKEKGSTTVATGGTLKRLERSIRRVEGFDVAMLHPTGRDVRSDKQGLPGYSYSRAARDTFTVAQWRETRFRKSYPGFSVTVLNGDGKPAHGRTLLSTVRATYS
jgi:hypothetical protein